MRPFNVTVVVSCSIEEHYFRVSRYDSGLYTIECDKEMWYTYDGDKLLGRKMRYSDGIFHPVEDGPMHERIMMAIGVYDERTSA